MECRGRGHAMSHSTGRKQRRTIKSKASHVHCVSLLQHGSVIKHCPRVFQAVGRWLMRWAYIECISRCYLLSSSSLDLSSLSSQLRFLGPSRASIRLLKQTRACKSLHSAALMAPFIIRQRRCDCYIGFWLLMGPSVGERTSPESLVSSQVEATDGNESLVECRGSYFFCWA